jgi:hypothetical protein
MPDNTNLLDDPANLETVVNEPIPTLYIDGFWGAAINDGVVKLNLYEVRYPLVEGEKPKKHIVARLAIPVPSFFKVVAALDALRQQLTALDTAAKP